MHEFAYKCRCSSEVVKFWLTCGRALCCIILYVADFGTAWFSKLFGE